MYVNYWRVLWIEDNVWHGFTSIDHVPRGDCSLLVPGTEDWTFDDFCNHVIGS